MAAIISIVSAFYGTHQINDGQTLSRLVNAIEEHTDVIVSPETLTPDGVDPQPDVTKTAYVIYHDRVGDALRFRAAIDGQPLTFSKGIDFIFYLPADDLTQFTIITDQSVYEQVYASFISGGTFTISNASMGGKDPYPGRPKTARIGYSLGDEAGKSYSVNMPENEVINWPQWSKPSGMPP